MTTRAAALLVTIVLSSTALAASWTVYGNARYGYVVDLPPGFPAIREADNGDGGRSSSREGHAELSAWGANLLDESFRQDVMSRIASDTAEGWAIGYRSVTAAEGSWSGTKGGRIVYVRAIPRCKDQSAFVRIEYDASAKATFDPIVSRVARSLKGAGRC